MLLLDPREVLRLEVGTLFALDESPIAGETAHSVKYTDLVHDIIDDKTPKWSVQRISAGL